MKKSKVDKSLPVPGLIQDPADRLPSAAETAAASGLNLANHFLIAMPSMEDPVFGGTVVYVCEHNENGVLGVVINKPTDMTMQVLFERIDLKLQAGLDMPISDAPIMFGGPVAGRPRLRAAHAGRALFVVADGDRRSGVHDLDRRAGSGGGRRRARPACWSRSAIPGWSPGQLEDEIGRNGWLTVGADARILFEMPVEERYVAAMKLLGIDPLMLTSEAGHA